MPVGAGGVHVIDRNKRFRRTFCRLRLGIAESRVRDQDARQLRVRAVQHRDVADTVHERAASPGGERGEQLVAGRAITACGPHLDELMIAEGAGGLGRDGLGQPRSAQPDHGFERVRQGAQMSALALGQLRRRRCGGKVRSALHRCIV